MEKLTLTKAELVEVTGYKQMDKQRMWLKKHNIPFAEKANGDLTVVRFWLENAPFAKNDEEFKREIKAIGGRVGKPDFSVVDRF